MRIVWIAEEVDEPSDCLCSSCTNEYNAKDVKLSLCKGFCLTITLCDDCIKRLKSIIKETKK